MRACNNFTLTPDQEAYPGSYRKQYNQAANLKPQGMLDRIYLQLPNANHRLSPTPPESA